MKGGLDIMLASEHKRALQSQQRIADNKYVAGCRSAFWRGMFGGLLCGAFWSIVLLLLLMAYA